MTALIVVLSDTISILSYRASISDASPAENHTRECGNAIRSESAAFSESEVTLLRIGRETLINSRCNASATIYRHTETREPSGVAEVNSKASGMNDGGEGAGRIGRMREGPNERTGKIPPSGSYGAATRRVASRRGVANNLMGRCVVATRDALDTVDH